MAAVQSQKKKAQPQKRMKQKQKQKKKRGKQGQKKLTMRQMKNPKYGPDVFVPKMLQELCQGKPPLPAKGNGKAIFAQRCVLTSQDGQQQCFLSNYMSSQAMMGTSDMSPAIMWPYKPPVARWTTTMCPQPCNALTSNLWLDGQQRCVLSNAMPSPAICGKIGSNLCTLTSTDLQYEANEMMPRQCFFAKNPSLPPY